MAFVSKSICNNGKGSPWVTKYQNIITARIKNPGLIYITYRDSDYISRYGQKYWSFSADNPPPCLPLKLPPCWPNEAVISLKLPEIIFVFANSHVAFLQFLRGVRARLDSAEIKRNNSNVRFMPYSYDGWERRLRDASVGLVSILKNTEYAEDSIALEQKAPKTVDLLSAQSLHTPPEASSSSAKAEQAGLFTNMKIGVVLLGGLALLVTTLSMHFGTSMFVTAGLESMVTAYAFAGFLCLAGLAMLVANKYWPTYFKTPVVPSVDAGASVSAKALKLKRGSSRDLRMDRTQGRTVSDIDRILSITPPSNLPHR